MIFTYIDCYGYYGPKNGLLEKYFASLTRGERVEIDEKMFNYFLEVLPPRFMNRLVELCDGSRVHAEFGLAEGAEVITAFWCKRVGYKVYYFAQHTKMFSRGD